LLLLLGLSRSRLATGAAEKRHLNPRAVPSARGFLLRDRAANFSKFLLRALDRNSRFEKMIAMMIMLIIIRVATA
jgi:hypothetical protein